MNTYIIIIILLITNLLKINYKLYIFLSLFINILNYFFHYLYISYKYSFTAHFLTVFGFLTTTILVDFFEV
jgi:hypothetical protein